MQSCSDRCDLRAVGGHVVGADEREIADRSIARTGRPRRTDGISRLNGAYSADTSGSGGPSPEVM